MRRSMSRMTSTTAPVIRVRKSSIFVGRTTTCLSVTHSYTKTSSVNNSENRTGHDIRPARPAQEFGKRVLRCLWTCTWKWREAPTCRQSILPSFQLWLSYGTREFWVINPGNVPNNKKRDAYIFKFSLQNTSTFGLSLTCLTYTRGFSLPSYPGIVNIQFSARMKLQFITKTYRLQKTFSLYISAFFPMAREPLLDQGLLIIEASRSHSDTPHSVRLLWTSDHPDAKISPWQYTTLTRETPMPPVGFESTIPASERLQTPALDRTVIGIGFGQISQWKGL